MGSSQSTAATAPATSASEKQQAQLDAAALDKLSHTLGRASLTSSGSDAPAHATLTQDDLARWSAAYADNKAANVVGTLLS